MDTYIGTVQCNSSKNHEGNLCVLAWGYIHSEKHVAKKKKKKYHIYRMNC